MNPEQYNYENDHADRFHDYEEDAMQDQAYYQNYLDEKSQGLYDGEYDDWYDEMYGDDNSWGDEFED